MDKISGFNKIDIDIDDIYVVFEFKINTPWKHYVRTVDNKIMYNIEFIKSGSYISENTNKREKINTGAFLLCKNISDKYINYSRELPFHYHCISFYVNKDIFPENTDRIFIYPEDTEDIEALFINAYNVFIGNSITKKMELKVILYNLLITFFHIYNNSEKKSILPESIRKSLSYMDDHIFEENISIKELAKSQYMSEEHFIRLFKKYLGETPKQFIIKHKLKKATTFLITTNFSISDIAIQCGFAEITYFNKIFKNYLGVTPSQYRKNNNWENITDRNKPNDIRLMP